MVKLRSRNVEPNKQDKSKKLKELRKNKKNKKVANVQNFNATTLPRLYEGFVSAFIKYKNSPEFQIAYEATYQDFLKSQLEFKKLETQPELKMTYSDFLENIYNKK